MVDRATKLRWRRRFRRGRQQVENIGEQAEHQLEEQVIGRLGRLWQVKRFLAGWIVLIIFLTGTLVLQTRGLSQYYQTQQPARGGTYTEGVLGAFTTANPLYATSPVDSSISHLLFNGLLSHDTDNKLVGNLAQSWAVNDRGNVYTVLLKPGLRWQDGQPLTSADVVFTYQTIQNPDADSVLQSSWTGVKVAAPDAHTVTFTLPTSLSSFPYSLTNGIVPQHILGAVPVTQLRSIAFDTTNPVGAGPFRWKTIEVSGDATAGEERIALLPNKYYVLGEPKLSQFVVRAFHGEDTAVNSFKNQELDGLAGVTNMPVALMKHITLRQYSFPLTSEVMTFFKTSSGVLADVQVRRALAMATNVQAVAAQLNYPAPIVSEPFLRSQPGYDPSLMQPSFNLPAANQALDAAGWVRGKGGIRYKGGQPLTVRVTSENTAEYSYAASKLQQQWRAVGVDVQVSLQSSSDLQTALAFHTYDALLYGISVGADPDVFAYWHSSQADIRSPNRLNFSEYKSTSADAALQAGRSRTDPAVRAIKYRPFLEAWRSDVPAVGLYQPRFLYLTRQTIGGLQEHTINVTTDRYDNVQNWTIREAPVDNR